jgi:hypothetical protein
MLSGYLPPYRVDSGHLYTMADLRNPACRLKQACDASRISDLRVNTWILERPNRNIFIDMLNRLLGGHLNRLGLRYTGKPYRRNYFPRQDSESTEFKRGWFNIRTKRQSRPRTVVKHYRYGRDEFWRHAAASISFRQFGDRWFLEVIPRYFFTVDGEFPFDSEKVGSYTTKIRSVERNYHVLNHLLFWSHVLSEGQPSIDLALEGRTLVRIAREPVTGMAPFAIPYDPAAYDEPDEDAVQLGMFAGDGDDTDTEDTDAFYD